MQRCDRCGVIATVDRLVVPLRRCDSELHLQRPGLEMAGHFEPGVPEHGQHQGVLCIHVGDELLDAQTDGDVGQLLEQARPDALSVQPICDRECNFG